MSGRGVLVVAVARRHHRLARRGRHRPDKPTWPAVTEPVSVIVPAHNEAAGIEAAIRSIAAATHPVEISVVDDGSTDDTAALAEALGLPGVRVIRRENGGKPAALNTGLQAATNDLIVMVDGHTAFERDTAQ